MESELEELFWVSSGCDFGSTSTLKKGSGSGDGTILRPSGADKAFSPRSNEADGDVVNSIVSCSNIVANSPVLLFSFPCKRKKKCI